MIAAGKAECLNTSTAGAFELLMCYLDPNYSEDLFKTHAKAYAMSILDPMALKTPKAFNVWSACMDKVIDETWFTEDSFKTGDTVFGIWTPRNTYTHFRAYAGVSVSARKADKNTPISVTAVLEDRMDQMTDKYQLEWNGFWHFFNVMQFLDQFVGVSTLGLNQVVYSGLKAQSTSVIAQVSEEDMSAPQNDRWDDVLDEYMEEETLEFADKLKSAGVKAPDDSGYGITNFRGAVIAELDLAWISNKIGFMTEEQAEEREAAENAGWKIFTTEDEIDITLFGGEN